VAVADACQCSQKNAVHVALTWHRPRKHCMQQYHCLLYVYYHHLLYGRKQRLCHIKSGSWCIHMRAELSGLQGTVLESRTLRWLMGTFGKSTDGDWGLRTEGRMALHCVHRPRAHPRGYASIRLELARERLVGRDMKRFRESCDCAGLYVVSERIP
jgi:hypothetical protein